VRLLDRLVIKELLGPWVFGVGMFSSLLMAATFLGRLTGWIVQGVPVALIIQMFGLLLPAILVKTFSMAVLLAALLGFGRLSSDSEVVALRAAGASIPRIVAPVVAFSAAIAVVTLLFNESIVPAATRRTVELTETIIRTKDTKTAMPVARTIVEDGKLQLAIIARNTNTLTQALEGVTLVSYGADGKEQFVILAKEIKFSGLQKWRILGGATLLTPDGLTVSRITGEAWPDQVATIQESFTDLLKERDDDFDTQSMAELLGNIRRHQRLRDRTPEQIANYEYGYYNKMSVPLAAIVFGALGAVLGIRNHRTGTASGFALAVGIIFGYVTLANFMNVWAQGGVLPAWMASFAPVTIGAICSVTLIIRRNG
jgi:lipopolysaccharide export system permease protein